MPIRSILAKSVPAALLIFLASALPCWAQTSVTLGSGTGATAGLRTDTNTTYYGDSAAVTSGDFYLSFGTVGATPQFWANNSGQRGLVDLGDYGATPLASITPPAIAGYTRQGTAAIAGHTYAALTRFVDTWDFAIFRVTDVQNNSTVALEYVRTTLAEQDRTLNVVADTTIDNAAGAGNVIIDAGRIFTVNLVGATAVAPEVLGNISGPGGLNLAQSGAFYPVWRLLGDATHTGGTTVQAGASLHVGASYDANTTGSISGDIVNYGQVAFYRRDAIIYGGSISGSGSVTKSVSGDLTFTGTNTYSGSTAVSDGRLIAGATNTLSPNSVHAISNTGILQLDYSQTIKALSSSGTVNIANATVLTVGAANGSGSFSGVIQGSGALVKTGSGTLTLSNNNTYAGGTTINGGSLTLGTGGTTGWIPDTNIFINSLSNLRFNRSDNITWSGDLSGAGAVVKSGTGTLTLAGNNTYSGATTINAGSVVFAQSQTFLGLLGVSGSTAVINSGATLTFNTTITAVRYQGLITGDGGIVMNGTGIHVLGGANTYTGGTVINSGSFSLDAGAALGTGTVTVNSSGFLRGAGSVAGDTTIDTGGKISGGAYNIMTNSIGTGTLSLGNATFEPGAVLQFGLRDTGGTAGAATGWSLLALSGVLDLNGTAADPMTMMLATLDVNGSAGLADNFNPNAPVSFLIASAAGGITGFDAAAWTFDTSAFQNAFTGNFSLSQSGNDLYLNYSAIPEPSTYAALVGLAACIAASWRRRRKGTAKRNPCTAGACPLLAAGLLLVLATIPVTAQTTVTLRYADGPGPTGIRTDTGTLYPGIGSGTLGDFYFYFSSGISDIVSSNASMTRTIIDLGDLGATPLTSVTPPAVGAYQPNVHAVVGHTYAALRYYGGTWDYAVFKVTDVQLGVSTTIDYIQTTLPVANRTVTINSNTTESNAAGPGNVVIAAGQEFSASLTGTGYNVPTMSGNISGEGSLNIVNSSADSPAFRYLRILGNATHTGGTTIQQNTVVHVGDAADPATTGSILGNINIASGGSIVFNRRDGTTISGEISGAGGVTKTVSGDLTFTGTNTYTGLTEIRAGRLIAAAPNTLSPNSIHYLGSIGSPLNTGSLEIAYNQSVAGLSSDSHGTVNLASGAVLTIGNAAGNNFSGVIQGDGSLIKSGTGTQILSGDNTFTGTTTVTGGTLQLGNGGTTGSVAGGLSVSGAGSLAINRSDNLTLGIGITGTGGLTKSGAGTLTLTGANTYSGPTTLVAGTLTTGASNTLSANSLHSVGSGTTLYVDYSQSVAGVSSNGTVNLATSSVLTIGNAAGNNFSGVIQGDGSLIKSGTGTQILSGDSTFTGTTTVTGGTLQLGNGGTTGSVAGGLTVSDAGWLTVNRSDNLTLDLAMSGTGNLIKAGSGKLTLTGGLTHTGQTNVSQGTLSTGAPNVLSADGSINVLGASGTLEINHNQTVKSFSGAGSTVLATGATLTIQGDTPAGSTAATSYTGVISGSGGLALNDHLLNIRSVSTYSGPTTLTGGDTILRLGSGGTATHSASILNTTITLSDGADLTGNGSTGDVIVNSGGLLGPGFAGIGTLATGNVTWNPGGILRFQINDALGSAGSLTGWDLLTISGTLTINATAAAPFVVSLESMTAQLPGAVANFIDGNSYAWKIVSTTGGTTDFDPLAFTFDSDGIAGQTSAFTNPPSGVFSLSQSGNDLYLNYTAIPEPSTYAAILALAALGLAAFRRKAIGLNHLRPRREANIDQDDHAGPGRET